MNYKCNKRGNEYEEALGGDVYAAIPKAVLGAIAVSLATSGGQHMEKARDGILAEWLTLYENGIVPQSPPTKFAAGAARARYDADEYPLARSGDAAERQA